MKSCKNIFWPCLSTVSFVAFIACKKVVEIPPPEDKLVTERVFEDSANANAAVVGLYIMAAGQSYEPALLNGGTSIFCSVAADELNTSISWDPGLLEFYSNSLTSATGKVESFWTTGYSIIYQANACIEGLELSKTISDGLKDRLTGEAKFIRALNYSYLVNLFGNVPLVLTTDYKVNSSLPRTSKDSVISQIKQDLIAAQQLLPENYVTDGRVRANKYAAKALLARVYLYNEDWAKAEEAASEVIGNAIYFLEDDCDNVFTTSSNEAILQFLPLDAGAGTTMGVSFIPFDPSIVPDYYISDTLLHSFETTDQRKTKWLNKNTVSENGVDIDYYYPFKYKIGAGAPSPSPENITVLRLAEQYLIRAEARVQLNNLTGPNSGEADLNVVRGRADLLGTSAATKQELLDAIAHENQIEFFCEWGHRWFDLKRTNTIDQIMNIITPLKGGTWNSNWRLFPIPKGQMNTNPFLNQNQGYF